MSAVVAGGTLATIGAVAAIGSAAMSIGGSLFGGYQAQQNKGNVAKARTAATDIFEQQKLLAERTQEATLDRADATRDYGVGKTNLTARSAITDLGKVNQMSAKQNVAYSGSTKRMKAGVANNMWDAYRLSGENLASAYQFTTETADINYEKSLGAAEKERQATLEKLEATPDTFLEGMFS